MKMLSYSELNALQVLFNKTLRIFMKSPAGDAFWLVEKYSLMKETLLKLSPKTYCRTVSVSAPFSPELEIRDPAYRIIRLMRDRTVPIQNFVHAFILHGSYASQDFISGWSDLDTMVVLKDRTFDSVADLLKVKEVFLKIGLLCYWIDPLAHHQLSFITEFDLGYYPQSFLPLPSYERGILLLGQRQICFAIRNDVSESSVILEKFTERFRRKVRDKNWSRTQYDWKNDLAHAFLLPSLMLQAKGVYVYKKESFVKFQQLFADCDIGPLNRATVIMKNWRVSNFVKYLPVGLIMSLPYGVSGKIVAMVRKPSRSMRPAQSSTEIERLTRDFLRLSESLHARK